MNTGLAAIVLRRKALQVIVVSFIVPGFHARPPFCTRHAEVARLPCLHVAEVARPPPDPLPAEVWRLPLQTNSDFPLLLSVERIRRLFDLLSAALRQLERSGEFRQQPFAFQPFAR